MRSDAAKVPCEILGCTRAAFSYGVCEKHRDELRTAPGPKCPRCGLRRLVGAHGVCRHCERAVLARREGPRVIDRGMCVEPGCWRRATGLGRCARHRPADFRRPPSKNPCTVAGCGRCHYARGLCIAHYRAAEASNTLPPSRLGIGLVPHVKKRVNKGKTCSVESCPNKATNGGLCRRHWSERRGVLCANNCGRLAMGGKLCWRCGDYRRRHGRLPVAQQLRRKWPDHCAVPGCTGAVAAKGLCGTHYSRRRKGRRILAPVLPRGRNPKRLVEIEGVTRSLTEWAQLRGLNRITVSGRLARGWTAADALSLAPRQRTRWTKEP